MGAKEQGAEATSGRWLTIPRTLSFVMNGDDVLLMKRGGHRRVFPNQYNGLGGHIERNEDPASGALREIEEESGLEVHSLRLRSIHNIDAGEGSGILLFVFTAISESREVLRHSDEGTLHWAPKGRVTQLDLVEDLPEILPRILAMGADDPPMHVHVSYDTDDRIVLRIRDND
ncbi:MAG: NUDIX domain-containing protein [Chloroflexi bacterium]|nr:NUDIX domain-containing protein [Chloroflexota bacterium]